MKSNWTLYTIPLLLLGLIWMGILPANAQTIDQPPEQPVVQVVMFYSRTCGHCEYVINEVLPPLQNQFGDQLEVLLIDLVTQEDVGRLFQTADAFGIPKEEVGVPFMIVGDKLLRGSQQIPAELPGMIETHLATGGLDYPDLPSLAVYLPQSAKQAEETTATATSFPEANQSATLGSNGFTLAIVVLVGMVVSFIYTVIAMRRGLGKDYPTWIDLLTPLLVVVGIVVAGYLTYVETQAVEAVCGPIGDCNAVQSSEYAKLFGVLPVGVLGLVGYAAILIAWLVQRLRNDRLGSYAAIAMLAMALFGTVFSIYLTYLEIWVIEAVCIWCLSSAVLITVLMLLSVKPAGEALDSLGDED